MNKQTFYIALIAALLLSNVLLAGYLFLSPARGEMPPRKPREIIIERLGFDAQQVAAYDRIIPAHRNGVRAAESEIRATKQQLYRSLIAQDTTGNGLLLRKLDAAHAQIERTHYAHFQQIRALCRPDQLPAFEALVEDLGKLFMPKPPRGLREPAGR